MINPVIPFVTEKISKELKYTEKTLFEESFHINKTLEYDSDISDFIKVIDLIKKIRSEVSINKLVNFELSIDLNDQLNWVKDNDFLIKSIFKLSEIKYVNNLVNSDNTFVVEGVKFSLKTKSANVNNNLNIEKQIDFYKKEIKYFESKLKNNEFLDKAPKEIIEKERDKLNLAFKNLQLLIKKDV
jgi:valyl-tRNA synthetase